MQHELVPDIHAVDAFEVIEVPTVDAMRALHEYMYEVDTCT